jgi:phosphoserine phosphatase RsbU/P
VDWDLGQHETRTQRSKRVASAFFWAMVMKLSPARRVIFVLSLALMVLPGFNYRFRNGEFDLPNLSFVGAIGFLVLLALELADRVTMKRDLEIAKEIQTWLMPAAPPLVAGVEMAFATRPANTIAGEPPWLDRRPGMTADDLQQRIAALIGPTVWFILI